MVPTQTLENFPIFGDNATKVKPDDAKYSAGFQPADVYPAEWVNYVWNKSSSGVTKLNAGVDMMEQEINNVLDGADKTPDATKNNQLLEAIQKLITDAETRAKLAAHPIGSLYWSKNSTDPSTLFGGTWARVKDKFILAAGDTYAQGATGGAATVTLDTTQIPSHSHSFTPAGSVSSHTHSFTPSGTVGSHTHSVGAHSHGLNSHKHSVGAHAHGLNSHKHSVGAHAHGVGTIATGSGGGHTHRLLAYTGFYRQGFSNCYAPFTDSSDAGVYAGIALSGFANPNINDTWSDLPTSGQNASGYIRHGNWGAKKNTNYRRTLVESDGAHTHTMSGSTANSTAFDTGAASGSTANSTAFDTGAASGSTANSTAFDSGSTQPSFTGSAGTTGGTQPTFTGSAGTTGGTGGGGAHNNMPPYQVYYCWERTA